MFSSSRWHGSYRIQSHFLRSFGWQFLSEPAKCRLHLSEALLPSDKRLSSQLWGLSTLLLNCKIMQSTSDQCWCPSSASSKSGSKTCISLTWCCHLHISGGWSLFQYPPHTNITEEQPPCNLAFLCDVRRPELWFFSLSLFPVISKRQMVRIAWIWPVKLWHGCVVAVGLGNVKLTQWRPAVFKGDNAFTSGFAVLPSAGSLGKIEVFS